MRSRLLWIVGALLAGALLLPRVGAAAPLPYGPQGDAPSETSGPGPGGGEGDGDADDVSVYVQPVDPALVVEPLDPVQPGPAVRDPARRDPTGADAELRDLIRDWLFRWWILTGRGSL